MSQIHNCPFTPLPRYRRIRWANPNNCRARVLGSHLVHRLLTGGQQPRDLQRTIALHELILMDFPTFDLTKSSCEEQVASAQPDLVIHAAAYTDVDGAERQTDLAMAINAQGTEWVARGAAKAKARLIYISTDYMFDGLKRTPYLESHLANPLNVYGRYLF